MVKLIVFNPNSTIKKEANKFICPVIYYKNKEKLKIYVKIENNISLLQYGYNRNDYSQLNNQINFKLRKIKSITNTKENYD